MTKMKDSGVKWIGQIPEDWKVCSIKQLCQDVFSGGTPDTTKSEYWDGEIPWLPSGSVQNNIIESAPKTITQLGLEKSSTRYIPSESILLAMTGATCSNVGYLTFDSCANQSVMAYIPKEDVNSKYIYYTLIACREEILLHKNGGAQSGINGEDCKNFKVPFINKCTQDRIVSKLDKKCGEINELIAIQEKEIEKLKEYKISVITDSVSVGIIKNRKLKTSQIEWIEKIPEDWSEIKLKYCSYIRARLGWKGLKAEEYVSDGYPLLSAFNIKNDKLDISEINFINQFRYDESPEIKLQINDIILVKDGAGIGKCAVIEELKYPSTTNGSLAVITIQKYITSKFLYYFFLSKIFQKFIDRLKDGMGVPHLFQSDLREIVIPCPSVEEQDEIVGFLEKKCNEINVLIDKKQQKIEKLQEYKKSLIYEYVTGKKEV